MKTISSAARARCGRVGALPGRCACDGRTRVGPGRCDRGAGGAGSRRAHRRDADRGRRSREAGRRGRAARHARRRSRAAARAGRARAGGCAAAAAAGRRAPRGHPPGRGAGRGRDRRRRRGAGRSCRCRDGPRSGSSGCLQSNSGSQKQRDDAATRRDVATGSRRGRSQRAKTPRAKASARLRAGSRREEIEAARARVAAVDAQIATLEKSSGDAVVTRADRRRSSPSGCSIPARWCRRARRSPCWRISITRGPKCSSTSRRFRASSSGRRRRCSPTPAARACPERSATSSSKAEFTPRNVQTAEDRSKLVYRVKIAVDNRTGHPEAGHAGRSGDSASAIGLGIRD